MVSLCSLVSKEEANMSPRVDEFTIGLVNARCKIDGSPESFGLSLEGNQLRFNGQVMPFLWEPRLTLERSNPGDDNYLEIRLDTERDLRKRVSIFFDCEIRVKPISKRFVQITVDDKVTFALGPCPSEFQIGEETQLMPQLPDEFVYRRASATSSQSLRLPFPKGKVKVWFHTKLEMSYLPLMDFKGRFDGLRPPGKVVTTRLDAYRVQQHGMTALKPTENDNFSWDNQWEKVVLDEAELRIWAAEQAERQAENKVRRQQEFEKSCGCVSS
jgi:hypothetical protein